MSATITFDSGAPDDSPATNPEEVLMFIIAEGADMGYGRPGEWIKMVKDILKEDFSYFFSIGNHDGRHWSEFYGPFLEERIEHLEALHQTTICNCRSDFGVGLGEDVGFRAACTFHGFFFILSDIGFWPAGGAGAYSVSCSWANRRVYLVAPRCPLPGISSYLTGTQMERST